VIRKFVEAEQYTQDEHVLGILFYGSSKYGLNNANSDIDLLIIYEDGDNPNRVIRGNAVVDDARIEYFKKAIREVHIGVETDFLTQSNASLSIVGKADIIYEKDHAMHDLQEYVLRKFKNKLPPMTDDKAREELATIYNRLERLKKYAEPGEYSYYFEHLYHLIIERLRRFYHAHKGIPRIETYKGFKLYQDKKYQDMFAIDQLPEPEFLQMYFELIHNPGKTKQEKRNQLMEFYQYAKREVAFDEANHRIPIKSRYYGSAPKPEEINLEGIEIEPVPIPEATLRAVETFAEEMNYRENEHFLGIVVYGSSLTGFNSEGSDIDLHVIMDNSNPNHIVRGKKLVTSNGREVEIEYFEKPIAEEYLMADYEFLHQDNAALSILGKGAVIYPKDGSLAQLQKYVLHRFQEDLPPLSKEEIREQISIMDNKIQKLENLQKEDSPYFLHFYHIVLEKMRETHHKMIGISQVATDKVPRIYTDAAYRKSVWKETPSQEFVAEYLRLVTLENDKEQMLEAIKDFYEKVKLGIELGQEYRIPVESELKYLLLSLKNQEPMQSEVPLTSGMLALLDKKTGVTTQEITAVMQLLEQLKQKQVEPEL